MSIRSQIDRINSNIAAAYTAANSKGATMPQTQNSNNLAGTINSIPQSGSNIDGVISEMQINGVEYINYYDNEYGKLNYQANKLLDHTTHTVIDYNGYCTSYKVPLQGGKTYTMSRTPYILQLFDESDTFIAEVTFAHTSATMPITFTVSSDYAIVYALFSISGATSLSTIDISIVEGSEAGDATLPYMAKIDWLRVTNENIADGSLTGNQIADSSVPKRKISDFSVTENEVDFISKTVNNLFDINSAKDNTSISTVNPSKGKEVTTSNYFASDFIPVEYGTAYYGYGINNYVSPIIYTFYNIVEYNENREFVAAGAFTAHAESGKNIAYTPSAETVAYIRFSVNGLSKKPLTMFVTNYTPYVLRNLYHIDGIDCTIQGHRAGDFYVSLGDSITRGYSNGETLPDGTVLPNGGQIPEPYGKYASELMGMDYQNFGVDGATVATVISRINSSSFMAGLVRTPDIITVMIGTNDMAQVTLGTEADVYDASNLTFYGGLKEIARLLSETYMGTTVVFMTPIRANSNAKDYENAVKYVADLFDIPCFETQKILRYDQKNANNEYYINNYYNGLHPNQAGHFRIGKALAGFLTMC